jgi:hypothetical protein
MPYMLKSVGRVGNSSTLDIENNLRSNRTVYIKILTSLTVLVSITP